MNNPVDIVGGRVYQASDDLFDGPVLTISVVVLLSQTAGSQFGSYTSVKEIISTCYLSRFYHGKSLWENNLVTGNIKQ